MKKILLPILISLLILPIIVSAESNYLYDVLKNEAESNGLAKEYTRDHKDSFTKEPTHKIYHWYATTAEEGNAIKEKNNIKLGDYCWKIIRTTDTGGVRVLFNGTATDGKCLGNNMSIGKANYSKYEDLYFTGSAGYMHNELYSPADLDFFKFGKLNQKGNKLAQDEYIVVENSISNNTCTPYTFNSSNEWELNTNCLDTRSSITLKVNTDGNYILNYYFSPDWDIDSMTVYKNNEAINIIGFDSKNAIILNDLKTTDEIKVEFYAYRSTDERTDLTFSINRPIGEITDTRYYFGNDVTYSNGVYTLKDYERNDGTETLKNTHYFCRDGSLSCESVLYIINWTDDLRVDYLEFTDGKKIENLVNDQLYGDNKNVINSPLKDTIDTWYENHMKEYAKYFEDTIFCQKMLPTNNNSYINKDGGRGVLKFIKEYSHSSSDTEEYLYDSTLKCDHENGMYSMSNPRAKLKYPIGPMSYAEALLLSDGSYTHKGATVLSFQGDDNFYSYWLLTNQFTGTRNYGMVLSQTGSANYNYGANSNSVVPMVSLRPEVYYLSGEGSTTNPYVISPKLKHKVDVLIKNETEDLTINLTDLTQVEEGTKVDFKVTPIKGYKVVNLKIVDEDNNEIEYETTDNKNYTFTMPYQNVTIIPSYERVKNAVEVEDNKNTKEFAIEVNDTKAVVYEDKVVFTVEPKDGYEVEKIIIRDSNKEEIPYKKISNNKFEFIMPDTDVLITPVYREIQNDNLANPKTYSLTIKILLIIVLIAYLGTIIYTHKKRVNS